METGLNEYRMTKLDARLVKRDLNIGKQSPRSEAEHHVQDLLNGTAACDFSEGALAVLGKHIGMIRASLQARFTDGATGRFVPWPKYVSRQEAPRLLHTMHLHNVATLIRDIGFIIGPDTDFRCNSLLHSDEHKLQVAKEAFQETGRVTDAYHAVAPVARNNNHFFANFFPWTWMGSKRTLTASNFDHSGRADRIIPIVYLVEKQTIRNYTLTFPPGTEGVIRQQVQRYLNTQWTISAAQELVQDPEKTVYDIDAGPDTAAVETTLRNLFDTTN